MSRCEQIWASNNPMGIEINLGYYALAECILAGVTPGDALLRWCGIRYDATKTKPRKRKYYPPRPEITQKVLEMYRADTTRKNVEIAKALGVSKTLVSKVLRGIGVKRARWDGHISTNPRYRGMKK